MTGRLVLSGVLDIDARRAFMTNASHVIDHATDPIEVDCSALEMIEEPTIGMLVVLARNAQRRGLVVILETPTPALRFGLARAGVTDRFVIEA